MEGNQPNLGTREPLWQDPILSPVYNEEMDRSVSEGPSLGRYFGLMGFIFYL